MDRRLFIATAAALGCTATAAATGNAPLPVVASFSILGDLVRQVGGERVAVQTLVGADSDVHALQPTPWMARRVAGAALLVSIGLGFEGWLQRLLDAAGFRGRHVVVSQGLQARAAADHDGDHSDHSDHAHDVDPHIWHDVGHAIHVVARIADGLCAVDATHCADHRARASAYTLRLQRLDTEIRARWARIPAARRRVITTHDAFAYYGAAYGVQFLAAQGVSSAAEPTPRALAALVRQIRRSDAQALFLERGSDSRLMQRLARDTGARLGGSLYADALSAAHGPAASYEALMRHNTHTLVQAVAGGG